MATIEALRVLALGMTAMGTIGALVLIAHGILRGRR